MATTRRMHRRSPPTPMGPVGAAVAALQRFRRSGAPAPWPGARPGSLVQPELTIPPFQDPERNFPVRPTWTEWLKPITRAVGRTPFSGTRRQFRRSGTPARGPGHVEYFRTPKGRVGMWVDD